jgi:hypothetical protein
MVLTPKTLLILAAPPPLLNKPLRNLSPNNQWQHSLTLVFVLNPGVKMIVEFMYAVKVKTRAIIGFVENKNRCSIKAVSVRNPLNYNRNN